MPDKCPGGGMSGLGIDGAISSWRLHMHSTSIATDAFLTHHKDKKNIIYQSYISHNMTKETARYHESVSSTVELDATKKPHSLNLDVIRIRPKKGKSSAEKTLRALLLLAKHEQI